MTSNGKKRNKTSYDRALRHAYKLLKQRGWPTLAYSAHMPQIINKHFLNEACQALAQEPKKNIAEWEAYFNYCYQHHPERFNAPQPYETLCWPAYPTDWLLYLQPKEYCFENFYPEAYAAGNVFAGINTAFSKENNAQIVQEKIKRRLALDMKHIKPIVLSDNRLTSSWQLLKHWFKKLITYSMSASCNRP